MSNVTIQDLRYAVAIAQCKSFQQAAKKCDVSQPTVSIAIAKVETSLGYTLFVRERLKPSVELTPKGKTFIKGAKALLRGMDKLTGAV